MRVLRWVFWCALVLGALLQLAANSDEINADGTSYLDLSDHFARGDWSALRNGYWSPLYPALIGLLQRLCGWSRSHELTAVHVIGFAIAIGCAIALERLLTVLGASQRVAASGDRARPLAVDGPLGRMVAYALGLYLVLKLAPTHYVTPDLLVAAVTIGASTLLLRARLNTIGRRGLFLLGVILGAGYLAKSAMFPAALLFLLQLPFVLHRDRRWRGVAAATVGFTMLSAPLVIAQSDAQGHLSFGESGRLNYAWYVNDAARIPPLPPATAAALGAPVRLSSVPKVTYFPGATPGTYSFWYDPSRWSWNAHPEFDLAAQRRVLGLNLLGYRLLLGLPLLLIVAFYAAALVQRGVRVDLRGTWFLVLPAVAQLAMYWLVHAEGRYVGGSAVIVMLALIAALRIPESAEWSSIRTHIALALALVFVARLPYRETRDKLASASWRRGALAANAAIVAGLERKGVRAGARIAVVGPGYDCYWARLAGLHVVAVVDGDDRWPSKEPVSVQPVLPLLARQAITAVVGPRTLIADRSATDIDGTGYELFLP